MGNLVKRIYLFATLAKLIAYYLLYQFIFTIAGEYTAFLLYNHCVESVAFKEFIAKSSPMMAEYFTNGVSCGILLSLLAMITHLLVFKYVRINKGFMHEVKRNVLILSTLFIGCMMILFNIIAVWLELENNMQDFFEEIFSNSAGIVTAALVAPILEELLFRGAIQGMLLRFFNKPWVAIITASLIFGALHGNPIQIFYATFLGMGLGWIYYRTGSLLPALVGHIINNLLAVTTNLLYGADSTEEVINSTSADITLAIVAAIFAAMLAYIINKTQPAVPKPWHEASEML